MLAFAPAQRRLDPFSSVDPGGGEEEISDVDGEVQDGESLSGSWVVFWGQDDACCALRLLLFWEE